VTNLTSSRADTAHAEGGALTNVRIVAGPVAGRQLIGDAHPPLSSEACDGKDGQAPVQRQATLIRRGKHFYARLVVNGVDLGEALVDTGASVLVLPAEAARRAGLRTTGTAQMNTANGSLIGKTGIADDVRVAGLRVQAVETVVLPDGDALIGMTALAPFSIALEGTRMTLTTR
jgi:clan AA aspartic protease (TIGR02281 family)